MKRTIANLTVVLLTFLFFSMAAFAEQEDPLAGLVIEDGWVHGTVMGYFSAPVELKVDCPQPPAFPPAEIVTLSDGFVTKKQMQAALKAAGQSTEGKFLNSRGSAMYTGDWRAEAAADITAEDAVEQAIRIGLAYFDALGVEVERTPKSISRPYDHDAMILGRIPYYEHCFSDITYFLERDEAKWKRTQQTRPDQSEYTYVSFYMALDGVRFATWPSFPAGYSDEPDAWEARHVEAHVIVSDSGVLVEAACELLNVSARRPLDGDPVYESYLTAAARDHQCAVVPAATWQDALTAVLSGTTGIYVEQGEEAQQAFKLPEMTEPVATYGRTGVITEIVPVLHTISRTEWAPFWDILSTSEFSDGWRP